MEVKEAKGVRLRRALKNLQCSPDILTRETASLLHPPVVKQPTLPTMCTSMAFAQSEQLTDSRSL